jgi:hypothetical protein
MTAPSDALLALEHEAAQAIGEPIRKALAVGFAAIERLRAGGLPPTRTRMRRARADVAAAIRAVPLGGLNRILVSYVSRAFELATGEAYVEAGKRAKQSPKPRKDDALKEAIDGAHDDAALDLVRGARDAEDATSMGRLEEAMQSAQLAAVRSERTARWCVNRSANRAREAVARQLGGDLLWVAERDACLHCLAYAGEVTKPGTPFPAGLTFADKPLKPSGPVPYPPLHPNCRCHVQPWLGTREGSGTDVELPDALKREARRSVVLGTARPSESETARLRAADRLIKSGAQLPASVVARGRHAVKTGSFAAIRARRVG